MKRLITICAMAALIGCEHSSTNHPIFKYYPSENVFEEGYVSKFYYHYYPDNPDRSAGTEIGYTKYIKLDETHFMTQKYNAAFDLMSERLSLVQGDSVLIEEGFGIRNFTDTTQLNLLSKTISVWESEMSEPYQIQYEFRDKQYIYSEYQVAVKDSIILNKPARIFSTKWDTREAGSDSTFNEGTTKSYYVKGMGFFGSDSKWAELSRHTELVEQMSVEEFEKRAAHGEHRVAWIDPENTMSDDSDFQLCDHERKITDYYWSNPDARYAYGKRVMLDTIYANLEESKLFNQNGRLVFRFVVNCEGKAGRFIARGYDLSYQPMEFERETVDHLFSIMQKLENWEPVVFGDELRDAYFYITFNIVDGEITDILP
ncbi:hypothetical protein [Ekhidna sp.]|uniref:hypothetical protein n=1 Tax=Ekhidna sp. TaxID=2608089 RepID=UPI00329940BC